MLGKGINNKVDRHIMHEPSLVGEVFCNKIKAKLSIWGDSL